MKKQRRSTSLEAAGTDAVLMPAPVDVLGAANEAQAAETTQPNNEKRRQIITLLSYHIFVCFSFDRKETDI
ncbi:hypothetical protein U1Q18_012402 [Sarracenia purpurea var. burkii]